MEKSLLQHTLDELDTLAEEYAQKYEPRFRKCARMAYMEGLIDALANLKKERGS